MLQIIVFVIQCTVLPYKGLLKLGVMKRWHFLDYYHWTILGAGLLLILMSAQIDIELFGIHGELAPVGWQLLFVCFAAFSQYLLVLGGGYVSLFFLVRLKSEEEVSRFIDYIIDNRVMFEAF